MGQDIFEINGGNFENFDGFIREFNRVFEPQLGVEWNGNLDVFNDLLYWPEPPYVIRWRKSWKSRRDLGYEAIIIWYLRKLLESDTPSKSQWCWDKLDVARKHEGPTMFDWLVDIIGNNAPRVTLELDDGR